jgi:hypothetical protein
MPKPFDATLKSLIRNHPADWLRHLGVPITAPPQVLDADLSAVSAAADTLIRVGDRVVHIDLEAGPDADLATRMLLYNVLAHRQTGLPVRSVVVLLRSNAVRANLTDRVEYEGLSFRFEPVRVWEQPAELFLSAGVGMLPLAVLARPPAGMTREQALPEQVRRMAERAEAEAEGEAADLMMSAYILAGMHPRSGSTQAIFRRVLQMRDSWTYQLILEEGAVDGLHKMLLKQGRSKFGTPTPEQANKLKAIDDLDRLERLALRLLKVNTWEALLRGR